MMNQMPCQGLKIMKLKCYRLYDVTQLIEKNMTGWFLYITQSKWINSDAAFFLVH